MNYDEYDLRIAIYMMADHQAEIEELTEDQTLDEIYEKTMHIVKIFRSGKYDNSDYPLCVCINDFFDSL